MKKAEKHIIQIGEIIMIQSRQQWVSAANDFWIMNAMCTFVFLFVVYFSFAPVISASTHRYVNYSDIQVLMMVTETETLMSTLNHNKFTYLDYVFFCYLHIYIYIVIHRQTVSFYQNSSVWLDPQDARSRDRNPSNFTID